MRYESMALSPRMVQCDGRRKSLTIDMHLKLLGNMAGANGRGRSRIVPFNRIAFACGAGAARIGREPG